MTPQTSPGPSLDDAAITAFLYGRNGQPHDLLGHHVGPGGLTITAYRPYATRVGAPAPPGAPPRPVGRDGQPPGAEVVAEEVVRLAVLPLHEGLERPEVAELCGGADGLHEGPFRATTP